MAGVGTGLIFPLCCVKLGLDSFIDRLEIKEESKDGEGDGNGDFEFRS